MSSTLKGIQISEPLLQAIMHGYVENLRKRKSTIMQAKVIEDLWEGELDFYESARGALAEAVIFSTLAGTAKNCEDFAREVDDLEPIDDPMVSTLRLEIFRAGIRCAVESIGKDTAMDLKISQRVMVFERKTMSTI